MNGVDYFVGGGIKTPKVISFQKNNREINEHLLARRRI